MRHWYNWLGAFAAAWIVSFLLLDWLWYSIDGTSLIAKAHDPLGLAFCLMAIWLAMIGLALVE